MAGEPVVHIGENSPEQVAYRLLEHVAAAEGFHLRRSPSELKLPDRKWLLETYAACINAVKNPEYHLG
jgi:hypothetical protein